MKEETRIFYEDVQEKAKTARSAHNRPRRGKSRTKDYTAKEVRNMSGPTYTINLNKPIAYRDFKALPENLQKEYVQNLIAKYDAGPTEIARVMGANMKTCSALLHRLGFTFAKGHRQAVEKKAQMRAAYETTEVTPAKKMALQNISLAFSGVYDPGAFAKQLSAFLPKGQELRVSLVVEVVESD